MLSGLNKKTLMGLTIVSLIVSYWIVAIHFENESNVDIDSDDDSKREIIILDQNNNGTSGNNTVSMGLVKLLPRLIPYTIFDWIKQRIEKKLKIKSFVRINDDSVY
jgi:hypothetical protein